MHTAIDTCIERGILADILSAEKGMVLHMLLTEYDERKHLKNTFEEGRREGIEEGIEKGIEKKLNDLIQKKLSKGKTVPEIAEELEEELSVIERIIADHMQK